MRATHLFHVPALFVAAAALKRLPLQQGWLQFALMIAVGMMASMLVGLAIRELLEKPLLRILRVPPIFWPGASDRGAEDPSHGNTLT